MSTEWFTISPVWSVKADNHNLVLLSLRNNPNPIPDGTVAELIEKRTKFSTKNPHSSQLPKENPQTSFREELVIYEHFLHLCSMLLLYQIKYGDRNF
ncbi:hypothetical protein MTP99_004383 [Tenebrio molitor]|jgi:hypothetical protein|nr:hypothetical protein MTP99_004383 [Tenebrio molitor]